MLQIVLMSLDLVLKGAIEVLIIIALYKLIKKYVDK